MAISAEQFLKHLVASRLMPESDVKVLAVTLPPDLKEPTAKALAAELVRRGKLTRFQALRLLDGKWRGLVLGKYELREKIGEGGMGEVYKAEHRRMKRPVVVKVLPQEAMRQAGAVELFQREVEAAAQLSHKHIVTAYDADEAEGYHFLVMEYTEGESIGNLLERVGPLPLDATLAIMVQAALGLEFAHSKGIVHCDIKPNNLLLDIEGVVKILDMGLARFDRPFREEGHPDKRSRIFGTIEYMAPEQADSPEHVDKRSDIYSLGCTLFRLLAGRPPYQEATPIDTLVAHRKNPIPSLVDARSDVPHELHQIFAKMVARNPNERFGSMAEVSRALEELLWRPVAELQPVLAKLLKLQGPALPEFPHLATTVGKIPPDRPTNRLRDSRTVAADEQTGPLPEGNQQGARQLPLGNAAVGIDLGTTYSVIAVTDEFGRPRTLQNHEGDLITPSLVLIDDAQAIVGKEAMKALPEEVDRVADLVKRELGHPLYRKLVNGRQYPPEALQAWILNQMRLDACRQIGEVDSVVITVPAYFDELRRKSTQDAGYMAGFRQIDILNEPTAAAIAFGFQRGLLQAKRSSQSVRLLVYDLGGGTFDVTVLQLRKGEFRALATDGDVQLGGRDWDQRLIDFVADHFLKRHSLDPRNDPAAASRLWRHCEDAKRTLSTRPRTQIHCDYHGQAERVEMDTRTFESLTADLLERTAFTTRETLRAAGLSWSQIDHLLLVGGSTRMPAVSRMLRELTGREPDQTISPDEAVAHGAALYANWLQAKRLGKNPAFQVTNVNSHSLGVVATDSATKRRQNAIVIPKNTPLPVSAKRIFMTHKANQRSILVRVLEGESLAPEDCVQLGKLTIKGLPANLPAQTPVELRFRYEENGRLTIAVNIAGHPAILKHELTREHSLSREHLDMWRQHISGKQPVG